MSNKCFTFAFKFGRAKVKAWPEDITDLSEWQLIINHTPVGGILNGLFESETEARHAATSLLKAFVAEENTYHTPERPVSARWRVYKLKQADHGTIFWYKNKTVE
ncbi:hypothetical protein KAR91_05975 [Candidatus Pacearchaeota archaeon]|nr:hypothetical protein [Candidatus Pacearchaeota archaeon]